MTEQSITVQMPQGMTMIDPLEADDEGETCFTFVYRLRSTTVILCPWEAFEYDQMEYIARAWQHLPENDGGEPRWIDRISGQRMPGHWTARIGWGGDGPDLPWRATKQEALQDAIGEIQAALDPEPF